MSNVRPPFPGVLARVLYGCGECGRTSGASVPYPGDRVTVETLFQRALGRTGDAWFENSDNYWYVRVRQSGAVFVLLDVRNGLGRFLPKHDGGQH